MTITSDRFVGVRVGAMLLCAYIWSLFGIGALLETVTFVPAAFHLLIPGPVRAFAWWGAALTALVMAFLKEKTWLGLAILAAPVTFTLSSYLWSWVNFLYDGDGSPRGWYLSSFYLAALGLVVLAAYIPDSHKNRNRSAIDIVKGDQ